MNDLRSSMNVATLGAMVQITYVTEITVGNICGG